ncbi:MAG: alcohol dehydrogenase catalytic domain-containing protein [Candidatus Ratteibacteria bacterium]|nr:alcohol dehydrogenase catalytic domain-containing protein [Candidatus Ratteibacteria bacterium]
MKAAFLTGIKRIEIREIEKPVPKKSEVLIKLKAVGICGSDIHYYRAGKIGTQVIKYPFIIGHECSGIIEDMAGDVTNVKIGQRVAVEPAVSCGTCEFCIDGRPNICPRVKFLGTPATSASPAIDGAFREYITISADNAIPVADKISFDEAALTEVMAIAVHSMDLVKINKGDTVAVFGSGPIGLAVVIMAKLSGASNIFATDLLQNRLEMAQKLGATRVINPREKDVVNEIYKITEGRGVDVAFEAAGKQETIEHSFNAVRIGGRVSVIGIPETDKIYYSPEIRRKEPVIYHVRRSNHANKDVERIVSLIEKGMLKVKPLVTHRFPLEKIEKAFDMVDGYKDGVIKAMIEIG